MKMLVGLILGKINKQTEKINMEEITEEKLSKFKKKISLQIKLCPKHEGELFNAYDPMWA